MKIFLSIITVFLLTSCSTSSKKILIMSKGKATINQDAKTITIESGGTSHEEQTVEFPGDADLTLQVSSDAGKMSVDVPAGKGYYVLNAKTDTLIGSYQNYSLPQAGGKTITQDDLKHRIDSVQQLLAGNIGAGNKNYYILPGKAVKITDNLDATMVGPFNSLTTLEQTGDKAPEVYKFYTTKDVRENLDRLKKMTVSPPSPNQ